METVGQWLLDNEAWEWIFSGIGVVIVTSILGFFFFRKPSGDGQPRSLIKQFGFSLTGGSSVIATSGDQSPVVNGNQNEVKINSPTTVYNVCTLDADTYKKHLTEKKQEFAQQQAFQQGKVGVATAMAMEQIQFAMNHLEEALAHEKQKCEELTKQIQALNGLVSTPHIERALAHLKQGDTFFAMRILEDQFKRSGESCAECAYLLGNIAGYHFDLEKKRAWYAKAVQIEPDNQKYVAALTEIEIDFDIQKAVTEQKRLIVLLEAIYGKEPPLLVHKLEEYALKLENRGYYRVSIPLLEKAVAISEQSGSCSLGQQADVNHILGKLYRENQQNTLAEQQFRKVLDIRLSSPDLKKDNERLGSAYNSLGVVLEQSANFHESIKCKKKALNLWRSIWGDSHPDIATVLGNLATTYDYLGQYQEALEFGKQSLAIRQKVLGSEHPDTAKSMNNLPATYNGLGQHQEALELGKQALAIRQKILGIEHPDTAQSMNSLATTYSHLGQHPEALKLYKQSLAIRQKVLGSEHPDTATSMNNLASAYGASGQYQEALKFKKQSLAIFQKVLGSEHPDTAKSMNNLAITYSDLGQHQKALELAKRATVIMVAALGETHPNTLTVKRFRNHILEKVQNETGDTQMSLGRSGDIVATSFDNLYGSSSVQSTSNFKLDLGAGEQQAKEQ